jgi:hypothetical protein
MCITFNFNKNQAFNAPNVVRLEQLEPEYLDEDAQFNYVQKQMDLLENGAVRLLLDVMMMRNIDEEVRDRDSMCTCNTLSNFQ